MNSPLGRWLQEQEMPQGRLAVRADVDRTDVCRVVNGQQRMPRKLRAYLLEVAPRVVEEQEAWLRDEVAA